VGRDRAPSDIVVVVLIPGNGGGVNRVLHCWPGVPSAPGMSEAQHPGSLTQTAARNSGSHIGRWNASYAIACPVRRSSGDAPSHAYSRAAGQDTRNPMLAKKRIKG
jgi:hypothetical protein